MVTQYPVRTIDLAALRHNVAQIRASLPAKTKLLAVVKADAYGHGIVHVARNALKAGAEWLAVARTDEGAVLRRAGINEPILVLGAASGMEIGDGVRYGLTMAVTDPRMIHAVQRWAAKEGREGFIHMKLDTGMGRIGVRNPAEVQAMLDALEACPQVRLTGVFTQFADADGDDEAYTRMQLDRFNELTKLLPAGIARHCANSAAIHRYPEAAMDMVRAGIVLYGLQPSADLRHPLPLKPVMSLKSVISHVKTVPAGTTISYGRTFTAHRQMKIATVPIGYADGFWRHNSPAGVRLTVRGQQAPILGRVCMDQLMLDVTHVPDVAMGDYVTVFGAAPAMTADDIAAANNTIGYEVICGVGERVPRLYIEDGRWVGTLDNLMR